MKKLLVLSLFGLISFSSYLYAGPINTFTPYLYAGVELGWAYSNWSDFAPINADNSTVAVGAKLGYQAARRFGVEFGGFFVPQTDQSQSVNDTRIDGSVESWVAYGAATFRMPLIQSERLYLQGKVGPAYRTIDHDGQLYSGVDDGHYWTAILGSSINYVFGDRTPIIAGVEYSHIFGSSDSWGSVDHIHQDAAPALHIVTATLSMIFKI